MELADEIFEGRSSMKFTDMTAAITKARDYAKRTAERKIGDMMRFKVITKKGLGLYSPTTDISPTKLPT